MPTLGIFAKRPVPGAVKTRLAAAIGAESAARFYEASLRTLLARVRCLDLRRVMAVAETGASTHRGREFSGSAVRPPHPGPLPHIPVLSESSVHRGGEGERTDAAGHLSENMQWFGQFEGYELWLQPAGDLGEKLAAWFEFACASDDRVLVIGSDSPTLPTEFIQDAIAALDTADCVIGPAMDGGYYLLGLRRPVPELFERISWSSPLVLAQTCARTVQQGLQVTVLPFWNDVDDVDDLATLRDQLAGLSADPIWEPLKSEVDRWFVREREAAFTPTQAATGTLNLPD